MAKFWATAVVVILGACSDPRTEQDLEGKYVATFRGDTATLTLETNHKFSNVLYFKDGSSLKNEGTWRIVPPSAKRQITTVELSGFSLLPSYCRSEAPFRPVRSGEWVTEVEWTWLGYLQLCFDSDVGYCYVKQSRS
jgi:hypothetical protein